LASDSAKTLAAFVGLAVQFRQRLSLHLQLHLRVFLEYFRIALSEQLRDPLVGDAAGAQPGSVRRSEIVNAKVSNLRPAKGRVPNGLERLLIAVGIFFAREKKKAGP
jgi:hypothetical protein